ncbi:MAG: hydrogenase [Myxococcota bacterium]
MSGSQGLTLRNGEAARLADVPLLEVDGWRASVVGDVRAGGRLAALVGWRPNAGATRLLSVVARDADRLLALACADVDGRYPALTPDCPQAHVLERDLAERSGVVPVGHPWLKPLRAPPEHFAVGGDEIHEVAVGPVHAGVIEPGHFRFQCHGETVLHLEIALGYQHRGVERALVGGPTKRTIHYMETVAGDTSIGHATAYAHSIEALARRPAPPRGHALRAVALELERLANHAGGLGALAGDIGYLPTASYCGRIRGDFLNMTADACGSRFGRGWVRPGGAAFDCHAALAAELRARLERAMTDARGAVELLWNTSSVRSRFEDTGALTREACEELGLVGPSARACGVARDVRGDFPLGVYSDAPWPVATARTGDVFARATVRWLEMQRSAEFLRERLLALPDGEARAPGGDWKLAPDSVAVSLVEGWRGEIAHVAITDEAGRFARYAIVDPSLHNWFGLAMAMRGQAISDFPLCNKSFDLSYCGVDR